jgi:hypothetical protein
VNPCLTALVGSGGVPGIRNMTTAWLLLWPGSSAAMAAVTDTGSAPWLLMAARVQGSYDGACVHGFRWVGWV